jgi:glycerophosphoryl diester phosphodiesterase
LDSLAADGIMRWLRVSVITILSALGMTDLSYGFDAQGHRGARGLAPENTLAGFARALSVGVDTLELDVGVSRDGVVVVSHNPRLEPDVTRDEHGNWLDETGPAIHALTLAELKTFDVGRLKPGTPYQGEFPEQAAADGARIPTLIEVLDLIRRSGNDRVRLNIETKLRPMEPDLTLSPQDFMSALLGVLHERGFDGRFTIQSFDWRTLRESQRQAKGVPTSYLTVRQVWFDTMELDQPGPSPWTDGYDIDDFGGSIPDMIKAAGGTFWSSYFREITPGDVERAHELGLQIKVWTVNEPGDMETMIDMGVDGIITDYPDRLRRVLEKLGMALPTPTPVAP